MALVSDPASPGLLQAELCLFTLSGAIVYSYTGTILTTAPAYGSLIAKYGRPAAAFTLVRSAAVALAGEQQPTSPSLTS